jgi:hypothetical protein
MMQYLIKIIDSVPNGYALSLDNVKSTDSRLDSIPKEFLYNSDVEEFGYGIFQHTTPEPLIGAIKHYVEELPTEKNADGAWLQKWIVADLEFESDSDRNAAIVLTNEILSFNAREKRNILLRVTDWSAMPDSPPQTTEMATYRQALRDVTTQSGFPSEVTWPTEP